MNNKRYTIYGNANDLEGVQEAIDLVKENERLHSIIKEAIEYIETHLDNTFKTEFDYITTNPQELLGILKGSDKE